MLYISALSILSLFDISPILDDSGAPVKVVPEFRGDSLSR
jgi:hypothetical protein